MKSKILSLLLVGCLAGSIGLSTGHANEVANKQLWTSTVDNSLEGTASALRNGAIVDAPSRYGMTPLMWAVQTGNFPMVMLLIEKGADVNAVHPLGKCSVVGFAAQFLELTILEELFKHGAKLNTTDPGKSTPLLKVSRTRIKPGMDQTKERLFRVVKLLIEQGADTNARDRKQKTPLILAAQNNNINIMELLLDHDARINDQSGEGSTALMYAAQYGHRAIVDLLLARGADTSRNHVCGCTALLLAAEGGHTEIVELLLKNKLDIHAKNEDGMTALMFAVANGHYATAELLLKQGARVNDKNNQEKTARMLAVENKQDDVEQLLHEWGGHCF